MTIKKMMRIFIYGVYAAVFILQSCSPMNKNFKNYFDIIKRNIEPELMHKIRMSHEDSLNYFVPYIDSIFLAELQKHKDLKSELLKNKVKREIDQIYILFKAFHRKLNDRKPNLESLIKEIKNYMAENKEWADEILSCSAIKEKNTKINLRKFRLDDSLNLVLPYKVDENNQKLIYYSGCDDLFNSRKDNLVRIHGVLVKKYFLDKDSLQLFFDVKVISLDVQRVKFPGKELSKGVIIPLSVKDYGRVIEY